MQQSMLNEMISSPDAARTKEMLGLLKFQRDQAADACVSLAGDLAAANARWNNLELLKARLLELTAQDPYMQLPPKETNPAPSEES